jgi:hypothetical protein
LIKEKDMSEEHIEEVLLDEQEVEVSEDKAPDMSYDKEGEPGKSLSAVDKAADGGKKAPARKGDKKNSDAMPKSKAGIVSDMYNHLNDMSKEELEGAYKSLMGIEEEEVVESIVPEVETEADFSEDLDALVESEATLSDEFKAKTAVIFESALKTKLAEEIVRIETAYEEKLEAELIEQREEFVEKVDSYLNYVVEQWMEENKLAIHQGLRTEIAEGFMNNLKDLFVESYVDVPESKIDLVDDLADQVEELEEQLFKTTTDAIKLSEEVTELKRSSIIAEATADLAETQQEKMVSLCADLDFDDEESFAAKVVTVKESYFTKTAQPDTVLEEQADDPEAYAEEVEVAPTMERYLSAIRRTTHQ